MKLEAYLQERDESKYSLAARSGVKRQTITSICLGGGSSATTALALIKATGGVVTLEDLVPAPQTDDAAGAA